MGAPPDTSASAYRHRSHTEDRETEQEKGQKQGTKWGEKRLEIKKKENTNKNYPTSDKKELLAALFNLGA